MYLTQIRKNTFYSIQICIKNNNERKTTKTIVNMNVKTAPSLSCDPICRE